MRVNEGAVSVARFAERIHALAGGTHHVASPLGAWMLLALSASADGDPPTPLEEVLGGAPNEAIELTCRLLADPHPLVACALALWERDPTNEALLRWKKGLPPQVETGVIPSKAELDEWAERHTLGIIKEFPGEIKPWMTVLMASALATKVTWREPFDIVPASELGSSSRWSDQVQWVLRTPEMSSHRQFIADTERAGRVAVQAADAEGGLAVLSVIASEDVPAVDVIAAAYQVAGGEEGRSAGSGFSGRSLFDLPLGETPSWTISEEAVETTDPEGREERYLDTTLPAWSAETELNLARSGSGVRASSQRHARTARARHGRVRRKAGEQGPLHRQGLLCRLHHVHCLRLSPFAATPPRSPTGCSPAIRPLLRSRGRQPSPPRWHQPLESVAGVLGLDHRARRRHHRHRGRRRRLAVAGTDYPICNRHSSESPARRSTATGSEAAATERGQAASQAQPLVTPTTRASPCPERILTSSCSELPS